MNENETHQRLAQLLHLAEAEKREVPKITSEYMDLSVEAAYDIQERLVKLKLSQGAHIIGPKMGMTSQAKMKQMNVNEPIYGYIFDYMIASGCVLSISDFIHPKVKVEIAFVLDRDIEGPGITGVQVLAATEYVLPALEIIDSRYENFAFTLPDVIADNASCRCVVLGDNRIRTEGMELDLAGVTLYINDQLIDLGAGAAVLGHPANSVAMLANMLARKGEKLKAGEVILTGGITGAHQFHAGDSILAKVDGMGSIGFSVTA